ncbi:MAG: 4-hydroxythreonine-4-phosphate dehydrogenase PdxA [Cyclobacteriaceae bacterium]
MDAKKSGGPLVGITIGDLNGVGPEVVLKTFSDSRMMRYVTPVIYASQKVVSFYRKSLNLDKFNYHQARDFSEINPRKVNVVNCWEDQVDIKAGEVTEEAGKYAAISLKRASDDLKAGHIQAIVTAPINKKNIQSEDFDFPGHTEFFTSMYEGKESLMMLVSDELRVGVVTGHIPLKSVADKITKERLTKKLKVMEKSLINDFGIVKPKIAVLGLNPHASDDGLIGSEEERVITPVINELKNKGKLIFGPFPADGFFGNVEFTKFDAVMAMYHDQGLTPFKMVAFQSGVNFTAGLPIVRTSPDHGTAYGIAGKGIADETSIREAVTMAVKILHQRSEANVSVTEKEI